MRHEWTFVVVDGFGSGELDFEARLAAADQAVRDEVDDLIMSPLVNGVDGSVLARPRSRGPRRHGRGSSAPASNSSATPAGPGPQCRRDHSHDDRQGLDRSAADQLE